MIITIPEPEPAPKYRSWKRSPRREKRIRTVERELAAQLDAALARQDWAESRRQGQVA